jgi:hypothetical protein
MISNKKSPLLVAWREFWRKSRVGFLAWRDVRFTPGRESDRYFNLRQVDKAGNSHTVYLAKLPV